MACIRNLNSTKILLNRIIKRSLTMSSQLRAENLLDEMKQKNPFYEKYSAKIAVLQQTSPEEFLERMSKVTEEKTQKKSSNFSEVLQPKERLAQPAEVPNRPLSEIMKMELISDKTSEEIRKIWIEYHRTKDVIAATIPVNQYDILMARGKKYPVFVLPLPRNQGYEFIMLQFAANSVHFTPLLSYQVHKENSPECLNIVHYTEMKDKGIVLMRGEYDNKVLNGQEAQCLANQLQMYYCQEDEKKLGLLDKFTSNPVAFKHMDLIKELENIELK